jgi:putative nucleotidyltransferase with HDIG domain
MLKKIRIDQLCLGMHLHELCGTWLDHPFWKSKFLLRDAADLAKLRASGVEHCWIDSSKGLDVPAPAAVPEAAPAKATAAVATVAAAAAPAKPGPAAAAPASLPAAPSTRPAPPTGPRANTVTLEEEVRQAALLVEQSRKAVSSLLSEARMGRAIDTEHCMPLVSEIASSVWRNSGALVSLARLKTHDDYSYMHSVAVCALMVMLARQLGLDEAEAREAGMAGLLHDIGKAAMPLEVLNKPGKLTGDEYAVMKSHPLRGHQLLSGSDGVGAMALDVCLHHHERPDGKGYPHGLTGDALSRAAKMGALCDVYDAITSNRPYKEGWDPAESVSRMAEWSQAGQFDAVMFQIFVKSLGIYPTGSMVRLQSGRLAVVIEQNLQTLVSPRVKVFFSTRSQLPVPTEVLDLSHPGCSDRIVGRESNSKWKFKHLDELWAGADALRKMGRAG